MKNIINIVNIISCIGRDKELSRYLEKLYFISVLLLLGVVYLHEFKSFEALSRLEIIVLIFVILSSLTLAKGTSFYMSIISLLLGHILFFKYNMSGEIWLEGITKNLPMAVVLLMVPILSIPVKEGGYLEAINYFLSSNVRNTCRLFFTLSSSVFGISSIANLGAVRLLHELIKGANLPPKFLGRVYSVGFSSCISWSPYFASVNLVLYYTRVSFSEYFFFGFIYGLVFLLIGNLLFWGDKKCQDEVRTVTGQVSRPEDATRKISYLVLNLLGLFIAVIIGERIFNFSSMMLLVGLLALIYAFFWSVLINKFREFLNDMKHYDQNILQVKNEVIFFISVGFLGVIMANTPLQGTIEWFFKGISGYSTFILVELIIFVTALLSVMGIHHVITVTAISLSISGSALGLTDIAYTLSLVGAYTVAMVSSPFAPFNIITGGLLGENSFKVSFRWNSSYTFSVAIATGLFVTLVNNLRF